MPRTVIVLAGAWGAALALAPSAVAQTPSSDPSAESPSGYVYELPLDSARGDAAPRKPASGRGDSRSRSAAGRDDAPAAAGGASSGDDGGGGGGAGTGAPAGDASTAGGTEPAAERDGGAAEPQRSAIRSENGFGSSTRVPGVDGGTAAPAATSDPSGLRVYGLIALGLLLAAGVGVASRAARRTT